MLEEPMRIGNWGLKCYGQESTRKSRIVLHRECVPTHLLTAKQLNRRFDMQNWTVNDIPTQTGKLAIVTGATGGLGLRRRSDLPVPGRRWRWPAETGRRGVSQ